MPTRSASWKTCWGPGARTQHARLPNSMASISRPWSEQWRLTANPASGWAGSAFGGGAARAVYRFRLIAIFGYPNIPVGAGARFEVIHDQDGTPSRPGAL